MSATISSKLVEMIFKMSRLFKGNLQYNSQITHLSILQLQALSFIKKNPNVQMREIAKHFRIEMPSATSLLNKLFKLSLVERIIDPKDRRVVRIHLTTIGESLLKEAIAERSKKIEKMLLYLSEQEKEELLRILTTFIEKIEEHHEN